jgi:hypothetical protein
MVDLLLDHVANCQIGLPETTWGSVMYLRTEYPILFALFKGNFTMYKSLLKNANMTLEFGVKKHTCLCYAVFNFVEGQRGLNYSYIREVIQHGGRICSGQGGDGMLCEYLQSLFNAVQDYPSSYLYYVGLKLVASTDHAHSSSPVYRSFKYYSQYLEKRRILASKGFTSPVVNGKDEGSVDCLNWMLNYTKTPSSLQHIARVTIRNCITPLSVEKCQHLPLPDQLIRYISLDNAVV